MLDLPCCVGSSLLVEWGLLASCGARAFHCSAFSCCRAQDLGCVGFSSCDPWAREHRLNSRGPRAQLLWGTWDLPGLGIKPVSPSISRQILYP